MFDLLGKQKKEPLAPGYRITWNGEWDLTLDVFRDLGLAMGAGIILIYLKISCFPDLMLILQKRGILKMLGDMVPLPSVS